MDKCEIEINENSKIKMETDEDSVKNLENHLGKLLMILKLTGIPITEGNKQGNILDLLQKICFPVFIFSSCVYLLYGTLGSGSFGYGTVIDTALPVLTCVMWIMMRCQTAALKSFFADLGRITSRNFKSPNRCLSFSTNAGIGFVFIYPLLLLAMRFAQDNIISVHEVFRILQEALFPVTMVVVYISVCCLLLQKLRFCKKLFQKLDLTCPTAMAVMKDYLSVARSVESFDKLFSNLTFVILFHGFFITTILVIDMFYVKNWTAILMFEALCELGYAFFSVLAMTVCAGNVAIEMAEIKSVVLDKAFNQLDEGEVTNNEKHVNLLLKKDVCVLTTGKAFAFNRAFLPKALIAVFALVLVLFGVAP